MDSFLHFLEYSSENAECGSVRFMLLGTGNQMPANCGRGWKETLGTCMTRLKRTEGLSGLEL